MIINGNLLNIQESLLDLLAQQVGTGKVHVKWANTKQLPDGTTFSEAYVNGYRVMAKHGAIHVDGKQVATYDPTKGCSNGLIMGSHSVMMCDTIVKLGPARPMDDEPKKIESNQARYLMTSSTISSMTLNERHVKAVDGIIEIDGEQVATYDPDKGKTERLFIGKDYFRICGVTVSVPFKNLKRKHGQEEEEKGKTFKRTLSEALQKRCSGKSQMAAKLAKKWMQQLVEGIEKDQEEILASVTRGDAKIRLNMHPQNRVAIFSGPDVPLPSVETLAAMQVLEMLIKDHLELPDSCIVSVTTEDVIDNLEKGETERQLKIELYPNHF